ncbi:lysine N-methyltransferase SMYD3 [Seminavis robusta]|uniref:Lysine N-methyltransferase SMYD3 n=1 Tax=Seminavis robusta TaxID=568900 RepID=A0A9N8HE81_9STRA|nr:lysine N-methyltransferase SMYD3 [Seminavis robusta]|eukprot:Sro292_g109670.1 lysine N-methyltransferase SMYD3 (679) ;mRNA; f:57201-59237
MVEITEVVEATTSNNGTTETTGLKKDAGEREKAEAQGADKSKPEEKQRHVQELTTLQLEGLKQVCTACGLGPRSALSPTDPTTTKSTAVCSADGLIPLKRCSVCHQAWYHDRACQQKDFPKHKKVCKRLLKQQQQQIDKNTNKVVCCRVQESNDSRGRYVVGTQTLIFGTVIGPHNATCGKPLPVWNGDDTVSISDEQIKPHNKNTRKIDNQHWQPIVAPVLLENHRRYRCVVCFGLMLENNSNTPSVSTTTVGNRKILEQYYPTRLCSDACRRKAAAFLPSEQQAISTIYNQKSNNNPPMILPTAVLLYRLVLATERTGQIKQVLLEQLQSERADPHHIISDEEKAHEQAVCATTWAMMKAITTLPLWHLDDLAALLQQVKLNAFSVCTGEAVALGVGLYTTTTTTLEPAPNLFNHSCRPNLLQTFDYGVAGQYPSLRLTVCVPQIHAQEELTVSYIDPTLPRHLRQTRLRQDYGFHCHCPTCRDLGRDELQIKCARKKSCSGTIRFPDGNACCDQCQTKPANDNLRDDLLSKFETIESHDMAALETAYQSTKQQCKPSSWIVQEWGERLLQALLDGLGDASSSDDAQLQYAIAAQAFQLTEELLLSSHHQGEDKQQDCLLLRRTLLRYKSIKLRLFLNVRPTEAMQELERDILSTCATFFPSHHEIMQEIVRDCCL